MNKIAAWMRTNFWFNFLWLILDCCMILWLILTDQMSIGLFLYCGAILYVVLSGMLNSLGEV